MALTPTDDARIQGRIEEAQAEVTKLEEGKVTAQEQITANDAEEDTNFRQWEFYDGLIGHYELERQHINGEYIIDPINELDIQNRVNLTGRLYDPTLVEDVVRIPEFDGGNIDTDPANEIEYRPFFDSNISYLENGLNTTNVASTTTLQAIDNTAVSVEVNDETGFNANDEIIIYDGTTSAVFKITGITPAIPQPDPDPDIPGSLQLELVTEFSGTIGIGANVIGSWAGFSDAERAAKTSASFQSILDALVTELDGLVDDMIYFVGQQRDALTANPDPDKDTALITTLQNRVTDYTNYKATLDISDSGLTTLTGLNTARAAEADARLAALPGLISPNYDKRFFWVVERCGQKGTLTKDKMLADSLVNADQNIAEKQARVAELQTFL